MRTTSTVAIGPYAYHCVPGTYLGDCFLQNGLNFERHIVDALSARLKKGDILLDIGASWGFYTLVANYLTAGDARVVSVEPNPGNVELLCRNVVENGIKGALVLSVGAGDKFRTVNYQGTYLNPIGKSKADAPGDPILVAPLDALVPHADIIKIDIEGFEPVAMRGMLRLVGEARTLITEFCPEALEECGQDPKGYFDFLKSLPFSRCTLLNTGEPVREMPALPICDLCFDRS